MILVFITIPSNIYLRTNNVVSKREFKTTRTDMSIYWFVAEYIPFYSLYTILLFITDDLKCLNTQLTNN